MIVGLIGYGYWGKIVSNYLVNHTKYYLKKVYSPNIKSDMVNYQDFFIKDLFVDDIYEIWNDNEIESVFIVTPIKTHYQLVINALKYGKNVMCEKPLALKYENVKKIKDFAEERGLQVVTDYIYTFSPSINKLKEIIDTVDDIQYIELSIKQLGKFYNESVYEVLGCHPLSILDYIFSTKGMSFKFNDLIIVNGIVETGEIFFQSRDFSGRIFISLNNPYKERLLTVYGKSTFIQFNPLKDDTLVVTKYYKENKNPEIIQTASYAYNEKDNINNLLDYFYYVVKNEIKSNIDLSTNVTKILESRNTFRYEEKKVEVDLS